jgi:hypothetical protein
VEEIIAVMRTAGDGSYGTRMRALIVVLWRAGLRINEALGGTLAVPPPLGSNSSCFGSGAGRRLLGGATILAVTAKEQLLERVRGLSEGEAAEALRVLDARQDPLSRRLDDAPLEDEEISPEEEAAVQEARDELAAGGGLISHEEIEREFGEA